MKLYDVLQLVIIAGIVLVSALYMLGRLAPSWRIGVAQRLQRGDSPRWLQAVGRRIGGSAGGCGSCNNCDTPAKSRKSC